MITIIVNGSPRQYDKTFSIASLIDEMGLAGKRIALERNGEIVPRSQFASREIENGDIYEIVGAVGGG